MKVIQTQFVQLEIEVLIMNICSIWGFFFKETNKWT